MDCLKGLARFFIGLSAVSSLAFTVLIGIKKGAGVGIVFGLGGGITLGLSVVIVVTVLDFLVRCVVRIKYGVGIDYKLTHSATVHAVATNEELTKECVAALKKLKGVTDVSGDLVGHKLIALSKKTWRSPGERIEVSIIKEDGNVVTVHSKPIGEKVVLDGGKDRENVERFIGYLTASHTVMVTTTS